MPPEPPVAEPVPDVVDEAPVAVAEPTVVIPAEPKPPEAQRLRSVAIVLTGRQPAYENVANELAKHIDNYSTFDLSDKREPPVTTLRRINDADYRAVIAIGLRAAQSAVAMSRAPVVFCQVFNLQDYELLTDATRGIAALPPLGLNMAAWKSIDPALQRVGAIIGAGHDELISEARVAAEKHGVELYVRVSQSDQETQYIFKRMVREIDGFWLFPDNRILSPRVLEQMLADAKQNRVRVSVFSESMLAMGASISASTVDSDIAETIVGVLRKIEAGNIASVPAVSPLTEVRIVSNDALLKYLLPTAASAPRLNASAVKQ
jgi:ABC-type uncharacterized transport system substrate-binding protein